MTFADPILLLGLLLVPVALIGYRLIQPVSDHWGAAEEPPDMPLPPERLAPASAPIEPR